MASKKKKNVAKKSKVKTKTKKVRAKNASAASSSKSSYGGSSEFIRSVAANVPAVEVVKMALQKGIKISPPYVYNVRMKMKNGHGGTKRGKGAKRSKAKKRSSNEKYAALEAQLAPLIETFAASIASAAIEFVKESL